MSTCSRSVLARFHRLRHPSRYIFTLLQTHYFRDASLYIRREPICESKKNQCRYRNLLRCEGGTRANRCLLMRLRRLPRFRIPNPVPSGLLATSLGNLILACASGMPGYLPSALTMDAFGRRFIQIRDFANLTVILLTIGFGYGTFDKISLIAFYILAQLFFNFGPNAKTFVVPAECFPTRYRSTLLGDMWGW
jgi:hypothetical protein